MSFLMRTKYINKLYAFARRSSFGNNKQISPGDSITITRVVSQKDVDAFAKVTGDFNSVHQQKEPAKSIVHGALLNGLVSGVIGTQLPGPGTLVIAQTFSFPNKCYVDSDINIYVEIIENRKIMKVKYCCKQNNLVVFEGDAKLIAHK